MKLFHHARRLATGAWVWEVEGCMGGALGDWVESGPKMVFLRVDVDFLNIPKGFLEWVDASTGQFRVVKVARGF